MSFEVSADAYGRFMGRYSEPLAAQFVDLVGANAGQRALDVGCGPGALTARLTARLGARAVSAIDPSESFVAAVRARLPEVDVRLGPAETLPFAVDEFDLTLAQLVVHFMTDPVAGLAEMARVTRPGGIVAATVWDQGDGRGPLGAFWRAVVELDPGAKDESERAGTRHGQLVTLFEQAGLHDVEGSALTVRHEFATFGEWWDPMLLAVGPAGSHVAGLTVEEREALRARCEQILPDPPFAVDATAWTALGRP